MSLLIAEGFKAYDNIFPTVGLPNSAAAQGWSHEYDRNGTGGIVAYLSKRRLRLEQWDDSYTLLRKSFAATSELTAGCEVVFDCSDSGRFQHKLGCMSIYSTAAGKSVAIEFSGVTRKLTMTSTDPGFTPVEASSLTVTHNTPYYLELEVIGGVAKFYVDDTLIGSSPLTADTYDQIALEAQSQDTSGTVYGYTYFTDLLVTDLAGSEFVGRQGPIEIIPMIPDADGVEITGFTPSTPGDMYPMVDDHASGGGTDLDTTFITGDTPGGGQSFTCSAETAFAGEALGYFITASSRAGQVSPNQLELAVTNGASELVDGNQDIAVPDYSVVSSQVFTTIPGGGTLTQANLEALEFGIRLET